jgi:DNA repair protein RadC
MSNPEKNQSKYSVPLYHLELVRDKNLHYRSVDKIEAAAEVFHELLDDSPVEKLAVIHCNTVMQMIAAEVLAVGSLEMVSASMADVFRSAILHNAPVIWLAHNHVSGPAYPSPMDYRYTLKAVEASILLEIHLQDHLVISLGTHWSIKSHQNEMNSEIKRMDTEDTLRELANKLIGYTPHGLPLMLPKLPPLR